MVGGNGMGGRKAGGAAAGGNIVGWDTERGGRMTSGRP